MAYAFDFVVADCDGFCSSQRFLSVRKVRGQVSGDGADDGRRTVGGFAGVFQAVGGFYLADEGRCLGRFHVGGRVEFWLFGRGGCIAFSEEFLQQGKVFEVLRHDWRRGEGFLVSLCMAQCVWRFPIGFCVAGSQGVLDILFCFRGCSCRWNSRYGRHGAPEGQSSEFTLNPHFERLSVLFWIGCCYILCAEPQFLVTEQWLYAGIFDSFYLVGPIWMRFQVSTKKF